MSIDQSAQGSQGSGEGSGDFSGSGEGQGQEPAAFDYKQAFAGQQEALHQTQAQFEALARESAQYRQQTAKDLETVSRMRDVFNPKEQTGPDPVAEWEQNLDYYLAEGLKAEKAGRPMPLTVNLGVSHYQTLIAQHKERQQYQAQMAEMRQQLEAMQNPQVKINDQAFSTLDTEIKRGLDSLYGAGATNINQKRALFQAVSSQLVPVLERLQKEEPQRWDMMRRDPAALSDLAQRALRGTVPPKALAMLAQEQLQNTEMPISELKQALMEAKSIEDPVERSSVMGQIRQQIFEQAYSNGKLGRGRQ